MNCQHICIVNIRVFITSGLVGATFQSNILAWFVQILPKAATTAAFLNVSFRFVLVKVRTVWFYEGEENRDACWYYMFVFQSIRLLRIKPGLGQFGSWGLYSRCCKDNWAPSLRDLPRSTQTERKADACWFQGIPFLTKKKKKITPFPSGSEIPHRFLLSAAALLPVWLEGESKPSSLLCSGVWAMGIPAQSRVWAHKQEISFISFPQWIFPKILPTDQACFLPPF